MPKSKHQVAGRVRSTYESVKAHRDRFSVQMMCRVLEVAVSGYDTGSSTRSWARRSENRPNAARKVGHLSGRPQRSDAC